MDERQNTVAQYFIMYTAIVEMIKSDVTSLHNQEGLLPGCHDNLLTDSSFKRNSYLGIKNK